MDSYAVEWDGFNFLIRYLTKDCDLESVENIVSLAGINLTHLQNSLIKCAKNKQAAAFTVPGQYHSVELVKLIVEAGANGN